jgi:CheY-like chemotaxis protein
MAQPEDSRIIGKSEPPSAPAAPVLNKATGASVLVVDDSPDNRLLIREYLKQTPFEVDEANNGAIAVAKAKLRKYDFILMDLLMPEMDGFEAMRNIREWEDARNAPRTRIIALTAWALKEAALESQHCGADLHLTKPIRKAKLLEALNTRWSRA